LINAAKLAPIVSDLFDCIVENPLCVSNQLELDLISLHEKRWPHRFFGRHVRRRLLQFYDACLPARRLPDISAKIVPQRWIARARFGAAPAPRERERKLRVKG
jgi:hypothetical protein